LKVICNDILITSYSKTKLGNYRESKGKKQNALIFVSYRVFSMEFNPHMLLRFLYQTYSF